MIQQNRYIVTFINILSHIVRLTPYKERGKPRGIKPVKVKTCVSDCSAKGGFSFWCSDSCLKTAKMKQKRPLMLAADYYTCVRGCIIEGGSSSECQRVCEE